LYKTAGKNQNFRFEINQKKKKSQKEPLSEFERVCLRKIRKTEVTVGVEIRKKSSIDRYALDVRFSSKEANKISVLIKSLETKKLKQIAVHLNSLGIKTALGNPWTSDNLKTFMILHNAE